MIVESSNSKPLLLTTMDKQPLVEEPPAYSDEFRPVQRDSPLPPVPPPSNFEQLNSASHNPLQGAHGPAPTVDQVHISERKHPIKGTFYIDPTVAAISRQKKKKNKKNKKSPHASFRSRHGRIDIELATTGNIESVSKADVSVSNHAGDTTIKLLPMPLSRPRLGLDVDSDHGPVTLFLPENFAGVVHLTTKKGKLEVMPVLSGYVKMVKNTSQEIIFMMGSNSNMYEMDVSKEASFCAIRTRDGGVRVGLSGQEEIIEEVGFWKRLGNFLTTHKSKSVLNVSEIKATGS